MIETTFTESAENGNASLSNLYAEHRSKSIR